MIYEEPQPEELSIPLDAHVDKLRELAECTENQKFWKDRYEKVKAELAKVMGDATVGTLDGQQVLTYRMEDRFQGDEFRKRYPDTYRSFVVERSIKRFDPALLKATRPDLYEQFQVRAMKSSYTPAKDEDRRG